MSVPLFQTFYISQALTLSLNLLRLHNGKTEIIIFHSVISRGQGTILHCIVQKASILFFSNNFVGKQERVMIRNNIFFKIKSWLSK